MGVSAQHAGSSKNITTAFALIGLYLATERGYTGKMVRRAHMALARRERRWPRLEPPEHRGSLTVQDVLRAAPGPGRGETLREWAASVWQAGEKSHDWVRDAVNRLLT